MARYTGPKTKIARKFGFMSRRGGPLSGNVLDYDNIDEKLCELHIWFKFLKFGFWRPTDAWPTE